MESTYQLHGERKRKKKHVGVKKEKKKKVVRFALHAFPGFEYSTLTH